MFAFAFTFARSRARPPAAGLCGFLVTSRLAGSRSSRCCSSSRCSYFKRLFEERVDIHLLVLRVCFRKKGRAIAQDDVDEEEEKTKRTRRKKKKKKKKRTQQYSEC